MKRTIQGTAAIITLCLSLPALAADYPGLRPSYPQDWASDEQNPLRFEAGIGYWYSRGGQKLQLLDQSAETNDTSHILEAHFRIEDGFTNSYLKGVGGYAISTEGEYSTSLIPGEVEFSGGQIGHVGADFGYMPFGNETVRIGGLIGYQYLRESPDKARASILEFDALNVHALRLGLTAKANLGDFADITAEAAGIPYASVSGSTPNYAVPTTIGGVNYTQMQGTIESAAYGASGELTLGLHPTENLTVRLGAKGWVLDGPTNANVTYRNSTSTYNLSGVMLDGLPMFRYGLTGALLGRF